MIAQAQAGNRGLFGRLDPDKDGVLTGAEINVVPPSPVGRKVPAGLA